MSNEINQEAKTSNPSSNRAAHAAAPISASAGFLKMTVRKINSLPKNKSLEEQYRDLLELREVVQKAVAKSNRAPSL